MAIVRTWDGVGLTSGTMLPSTVGAGDFGFDQVNGAWLYDGPVVSSDPTVGGGARTLVWGGLTVGPDCAARHYANLSGLPVAETDLVLLKGAAGAYSARVQVRPTGVFLVRDSTGTNVAASVATLPGAGEYRVEVQQASLTSATVSVFAGESDTPVETLNAVGTFIDVINVQFGQDGSDSENMPSYGQRNFAVADDANVIGPYIVPPPPTAPRLAIIGDSLTAQDGNGEADLRAVFEAAGYRPDSIYFYATGGKPIVDADSLGKSTLTNIAEARAQLGEVEHWVIALGTNGVGDSDAKYESDMRAVLEEIGPGPSVTWIGLAFKGVDNTNAAHFNPIIKSTVEDYFGDYADWQNFIHDGRDETGLWSDLDSTHMTAAGYAIRNDFYVASTPEAGQIIVGVSGTPPLTYSLNRLAGTLVDGEPTLAAVGAANVYAGTSGLALMGALNAKNGSVGVATQGVLNQLAGTTGLAVDEAADRIVA